MVPGGASIFVVSGSSVNERQDSNALVFGGQTVCVCVYAVSIILLLCCYEECC